MKKSNFKKMLVLVLSFAMVLAFTACGGGGGGDEGGSGGSGDGKSITLFNSKN